MTGHVTPIVLAFLIFCGQLSFAQPDTTESAQPSVLGNIRLSQMSGYDLSTPVAQAVLIHHKLQHNQVLAYGQVNSRSDVLNQPFLSRFLLGGFIDDADKEKISGSLKEKNHWGFRNETGLNFNHLFKLTDTTAWRWSAAYDYNQQFSSSFSADFFNLAFFGNARFEDATADIAGFRVHLANWHALSGGLHHVLTGNGWQTQFGASASLLLGTTFRSVDVPDGSIYTAPDGDYIDIAIDLQSHGNDQRGINGIGAGLSLYFMQEIDRWSITASIDNLGMIFWNDSSDYVLADTAIRFSGFNTSGFFLNNDSLFTGFALDSLLGKNALRSGTDNYRQHLNPEVAVRAYYSSPFNVWSVGIAYSTPFRLPLIDLGYYRHFHQLRGGIGANISYGGFGGFNAGIHVQKTIENRVNLRIGCNSIPAFFSSSFSGPAIFAGANIRW